MELRLHSRSRLQPCHCRSWLIHRCTSAKELPRLEIAAANARLRRALPITTVPSGSDSSLPHRPGTSNFPACHPRTGLAALRPCHRVAPPLRHPRTGLAALHHHLVDRRCPPRPYCLVADLQAGRHWTWSRRRSHLVGPSPHEPAAGRCRRASLRRRSALRQRTLRAWRRPVSCPRSPTSSGCPRWRRSAGQLPSGASRSRSLVTTSSGSCLDRDPSKLQIHPPGPFLLSISQFTLKS